MSPEEAEAFARGLYFLASVDEIHDREADLIREFIEETHAPVKFEELGKGSFSIVEAAQVLSASYLRRIFVKTAILLVRADGRYSPEEREALGLVADAFHISNAEFGQLELEAEGATFD